MRESVFIGGDESAHEISLINKGNELLAVIPIDFGFMH